MSREIIASLATALMPLVALALAAVAARATAALTAHLRDRRLAAAVQLAAYGAAGVVADLAQHVVDALKDPTKPGTWDKVAASAAREAAIVRLRSLYPGAVQVITAALGDPGKVDELLGTLVERAVVDLKSRAPKASAGELLSVESPAPSKVPAPIPPASDGQRGTVRVGALVGISGAVILATVVGAVIYGCPNWNRPACPTPGVYSCVGDQPHYCAPTKELTPIGDEPCGLQGRVCALNDTGVARCAPSVDAGADGGAR